MLQLITNTCHALLGWSQVLENWLLVQMSFLDAGNSLKTSGEEQSCWQAAERLLLYLWREWCVGGLSEVLKTSSRKNLWPERAVYSYHYLKVAPSWNHWCFGGFRWWKMYQQWVIILEYWLYQHIDLMLLVLLAVGLQGTSVSPRRPVNVPKNTPPC